MDTKKTLCRIGAQMKEAGLVTACDGNISFRRSDGAIVITPSGVPKGELKPKHLLVVEMSMGQMVDDVRLAVEGSVPVSFYGRTGGIIPTPKEVLGEIKKLLK